MSASRGRAMTAGIVLLIVIGVLALLRLTLYRGLDGAMEFGWPERDILRYRMTPLVVALLVGAGLATSGLLLQALLRNALASPFILGLSSGAGLGVVTSMYVAAVFGVAIGDALQTGPALVGSIVVLGIVYLLGHRRGGLDPLTLILVGVVVSAICGALTMFIQQIGPPSLRIDLMRWLFGRIPQSLDALTLTVAAVLVIAGVVIAFALGKAMDIAMLADDEARSVGLSIGRLRQVLFLIAGMLAAATVTIAGPIAFVGLIAPHTARLVIGARHQPLVPIAAGVGIVMVLGADLAGQLLPFSGGRVPVGIFTALIGGPAFIWLLRQRPLYS